MLLSFIAWSPFPFLGRPFDLRFLVNNAVCNVIYITIYGERFDYGDETFKKLLHLFENSLNEEAGFLPQVNQECNTFVRSCPLLLESIVLSFFFLFAPHNIFSLSLVLASQLLNVMPFLLRIPGMPQKVFRGQKAFMDFIDVLIDKHMQTWNPAYIQDFTDAFLKEMEKVG